MRGKIWSESREEWEKGGRDKRKSGRRVNERREKRVGREQNEDKRE